VGNPPYFQPAGGPGSRFLWIVLLNHFAKQVVVRLPTSLFRLHTVARIELDRETRFGMLGHDCSIDGCSRRYIKGARSTVPEIWYITVNQAITCEHHTGQWDATLANIARWQCGFSH